MHSYALIGRDRNHNEYPVEFQGYTPEDAARRACEARNFVDVLSGDQSGRRTGKANGIYYRKPLYKRPDTDLDVPKGENSNLAQAIGAQLARSGAAILQDLREKGYKLWLEDSVRTGKHDKLMVDHGPLTVMTDHIRSEIKTHKERIVQALQEEEASKKSDTPPIDPNDLYKGQGRHEVVMKMLPQMPNPFTRQDFIERLKASGYDAFANDRKKIENGLTYPAAIGLIERLGGGKFAVTKKLKQAAKKHEKKHPSETTEQTDLPIEEVPQPQLAAPPIPVQVAPEPAPEPAEPAPAPEVSAPAFMPQAVPQAALDALIALAAESAATADDEGSRLAASLEGAVRTFETTVLDGIAAIQAAADPLIRHLKAHNAARKQFKLAMRR